MPHRETSSSSSCLLRSLHLHLASARLDQSVAILPLLASRGLRPDIPTLTSLLRLCLLTRSLSLARRVHLHLRLTGLKGAIPSHPALAHQILDLHFRCRTPDAARALFDRMPSRTIFTYNSMLSGYARLGMPAAARRLFEKMTERDIVSWNTVILALARGGSTRDAIRFYSRMRKEFGEFNLYTFSSTLVSCVRLGQLGLAKQFHGQILVVGFLGNLVVTSSLLDSYAKCGSIQDARGLFDEMRIKDVYAWTALVSGYAKSGDLTLARQFFNRMPQRNHVSWAAMISGYVRSGLSLEALNLFAEMIEGGMMLDQFVVSSSLCACASIALLKHGKQIHCYFIRRHFHPNVIALSSLIDLYSKCGDLATASLIFDRTPKHKRDAVLWNTMISSFGQHGDGKAALKLFDEMIKAGGVPDSNTFVVILTACSHSGFVDEGMQIFESMDRDHHVVPNEEHHACYVDLLGRAGLLKETKNWICRSQYKSSVSVWKAFLGACKIHNNVDLGTEAAECLIKLEPQWSAGYVLLSNLLSEAGWWESAEKVRSLMENRKVRKEKAVSSFGINNVIHSFNVSDHQHPLIAEVSAISEQLAWHMENDVSST